MKKLVILIFLILPGCSTDNLPFDNMPPNEHVDPRDPLEQFNRSMSHVNDVFEVTIVRPVAMFYRTLVPPVIRQGIWNFIYNLTLPIQSISYIVAGNPKRAGEEFFRFTANSTFGVLGFLDASEVFELKKEVRYDMDKAFGDLGFPQGPYLVLPILGQMSFRDLFTFILAGMVNPISILENQYISPNASAWHTAARYGVIYADYIDKYGELTSIRDKIDPYVALREAYLQERKQGQEEAYTSPKISIED